jgi:hypothetical protein
MNERINGLWWQARIGYNNQNCDPEVLEKFAQLIVRECMQLNSQELSITAIERLLPMYQEHFGVEP